ncbi:restriction endonuclease subunit S, partial [Macrococcus capreoli]|uniref:restriction endonuclease subunit S n=1 Tax=Macrococcus capreoli TaxID=2982690 RepID=UPI0021D5A7E8
WEQRELGELVDIKSGYSPSKFREVNIGELFLKVDDLNHTIKNQNYSKIKVKKTDLFNLIPAKSVIFPKRGAAILTNKIRLLNQESYIDTNLMALIPIKIESEFLFYIIGKTGLYKMADTSTIPQINNKHIEPYSIKIPKLNEQKKIACFLNNIDQTITLLQ